MTSLGAAPTSLPAPADLRAFFILDVHAFVWRFASGSGRWGSENFARWLGGWLRARKPPRIVAADDFGGPTFRHARLEAAGFAAYKGDRRKLDEEAMRVYRRVREDVAHLLEDLGIPTVAVEGFEADDVIATITHWAAGNRWSICSCDRPLSEQVFAWIRGERECATCDERVDEEGEPGRFVVIVGQDRDLLQLVGHYPGGGDAVLWDGYERVWGPPECVAEMGVRPTQIPEYFALVGGKNNLPGVRGIGPKAAREILTAFDSVNDAISYANMVPGDGLRMKSGLRDRLTAHAAAAQIGLELASLRTDVPIDFAKLASDCAFQVI